MIIKEYTEINMKEILELYDSVGWINYTNHPERLRRGIENSLLNLAVYEDKILIGLLRAVGDGETCIFIQDILIKPFFQRQGIGTRLIKRVLEKYKNCYQIQLLTDNRDCRIKFYESLGFKNGIKLNTVPFMIINA